MDDYRSNTVYSAPEFNLNQHLDKFLELTKRNNDCSYNKVRSWQEPLMASYPSPHVCTDNFSGINVICTNAAWDDAHPAGTSLNDLIRMDYESYYDFVQSGYNEDKVILRIKEPLSELSETDLYLTPLDCDLFFDSFPSSGSCDMKVILTTVDGVEKIMTGTIDFDKTSE